MPDFTPSIPRIILPPHPRTEQKKSSGNQCVIQSKKYATSFYFFKLQMQFFPKKAVKAIKKRMIWFSICIFYNLNIYFRK